MLIAFLNMKEDFQDSAEMESINFSVQALIKDVRRVIEDDVNRALVPFLSSGKLLSSLSQSRSPPSITSTNTQS